MNKRPIEIFGLVGLAWAALIVSLLAADQVAGLFLKKDTGRITYKSAGGQGGQELYLGDSLLGYKLKPGAVVRVNDTRDNSTIYDAVYSIDEYGRRFTPAAKKQPGKNSILFFGCSFTFGEGVNDDQTLPYYAGEMLKDYTPVNFGVCGYGPQQMLLQLENDGISGRGKGGKAVLIYLCIGHHINRAVGSMRIICNWGNDNLPCYALSPAGELSYKGNFLNGRPFLSAVYLRLGKTHLGQYLLQKNLDIPFWFTDKQYALFAKLIDESRKVFYEKFKSDDFYVVLFPSRESTDRLVPFLQKAGIKYIDYRTHREFLTDEYLMKDHHPNPAAYKKLAAMITGDLEKLKAK